MALPTELRLPTYRVTVTPVATAYVLITAPSLRDFTVGIQYNDGKVLLVSCPIVSGRVTISTGSPQLLTAAQVAALGLRLTPIHIETTTYPIAASSTFSWLVQPCTIVYSNTEVVAAISVLDRLIFRGATSSSPDGAVSASPASEILKGATIHSRLRANGRPWGAVTNTASGFGQYAVG